MSTSVVGKEDLRKQQLQNRMVEPPSSTTTTLLYSKDLNMPTSPIISESNVPPEVSSPNPLQTFSQTGITTISVAPLRSGSDFVVGNSDDEGDGPDQGTNNDAKQSEGQEKEKKKTGGGKRFTAEEDLKIKRGVEKYGREWKKIVEEEKLERTTRAIQKRYDSVIGVPPLQQQMAAVTPQSIPIIPDVVVEPPSKKQKTGTLDNFFHVMNNGNSDAYTKEIESARKKSEPVNSYMSKLENEREKLRAEVENRDTKISDYKSVMVSMFRKFSNSEKALARLKLAQDSSRIGTVLQERVAGAVYDTWQDGELMKDLENRLATVAFQQKQIAHAKQEFLEKKNAKKQAKETSTDRSFVDSDEYERQQIEFWEMRSVSLQLEHTQLVSEKQRLSQLRNLHIREFKRIRDEDNSTFKIDQLYCSRYVILNLLGKGGFSEVFKAWDLEKNREVACKIHQLNTSWTTQMKANYVKHAFREYKIHEQMKHPRIVEMLDVFEIDVNSFCTVLEYCDGQDLDLHIKNRERLAESEAKSILVQIMSALEYLASKGVIHYDLKPANILLCRDGIKISDFGLSKIVDGSESSVELTSQGAGTYWYLPPECMIPDHNQQRRISPKVDVWSMGVVFYQMLFGKKPFGDGQSQAALFELRQRTPNEKLKFLETATVSEAAKSFISRCLINDQDMRPNIQQLLDDPYISNRTENQTNNNNNNNTQTITKPSTPKKAKKEPNGTNPPDTAATTSTTPTTPKRKTPPTWNKGNENG